MKKAIPIFFAFLLLFNYVGLLATYMGQMFACKQEAMSYIASHNDFSDKQLVAFQAGTISFQLLNGEEILQGKMLYDIVKTEVKNGATVYYAISDDKEDAFWNEISQLAKNNSDTHQVPGKSTLPEVLKYCGQQELSGHDITLLFQHTVIINEGMDLFFYQSPYGDIFSPPPQALVA